MTTKPQTTPTPWRVERANPSPTTGEWMIAGATPGYLAEVRDCGSGDVSANAALIVKAVNCHEMLVDALERCVNNFDLMFQTGELKRDDFDGLMKQCNSAIRKATV